MSEHARAPALLHAAIARIAPPCAEAKARQHLDALTKPQGSLGVVEDLAARMESLGLMTHAELPRAVFVFAADHGLAAEGVSAYPSAVTAQMVANFFAGGAAINVLARLHGAQLHVVNAGVASRLPANPRLIDEPVRLGSRNMLYEPAMSELEFAAALALGLRCADAARRFKLVAVGEMGIGNTASASALTAALTGAPVDAVTGRGTGLDDAGHARKIAVLTQVLACHAAALAMPAALATPAEMLRRLGGLEIAAMTGFMIGAAGNGSAVLVDGFISSAAAAFALAFAPAARPYLFAAHRSPEPGHAILLANLGLTPLLDLRMRLGEGTGAVLAMPLLAAAHALYREMATFASAHVSGASR